MCVYSYVYSVGNGLKEDLKNEDTQSCNDIHYPDVVSFSKYDTDLSIFSKKPLTLYPPIHPLYLCISCTCIYLLSVYLHVPIYMYLSIICYLLIYMYLSTCIYLLSVYLHVHVPIYMYLSIICISTCTCTYLHVSIIYLS